MALLKIQRENGTTAVVQPTGGITSISDSGVVVIDSDGTGMRAVADAAARAAAVPDYVGQLLYQIDTATVYFGSDLFAGDWLSDFGADNLLIYSSFNRKNGAFNNYIDPNGSQSGDVTLALPTNGTIVLPNGSQTLYGTATGSITSAQLLASLTNATGTGAAVFNNTPTITTPTIAAINGSTASSGTLTLQSTTDATKGLILFQQNGGNMRIGVNTTSATTTPVMFGMGGTYGTNTPGAATNLKFELYSNGTDRYGIGFTAAAMEYQAGSLGGHVFYTNTGNFVMIVTGGGNGTTAGRVGIGSITPGEKLEVVGTTKTAGFRTAYVAKTGAYTLVATTDHTVDCTSGTFAITLPTAVGITGQVFVIKNSGAGVITMNTTSAQTIDGSASGALTLTTLQSMTVQSNGANWIII